MTTSEENKTVTPDLVAQKSETYGIAAEVKKSLPQDQARWEKYVEQLIKYDDDLTGWWTPDGKISCADAVMLIHQSRGRRFSRYLQEIKEKNPDAVGENTSIVEFNSSAETRSYYFFRLEYGTVRDSELLETLNDGIQVPLDKILVTFPNVKYYDSPPPTAYLLKELWMETFPSMLDGAEYDEKYKATKFSASVREVTEELQKAYGSAKLRSDQRSVEFPTYKWIKGAFEKLVEFKLALPPSDENDTYHILFKTLRGDVLNRFIELEFRQGRNGGQTTEEDHDQLPLFPDEEN